MNALTVGDGDERVRVATQTWPAVVSTGARRVLLIHGNPSRLEHWANTIEALRPHASLAAYDLPGLGRSDDYKDGQHTLERSARTAFALLDTLGWHDSVDVIGQSHGGMIAVAMAASRPERIGRLALLSTGGTPTHEMYRVFETRGLDHLLFGFGRVASSAARSQWSRRMVGGLIRSVAKNSFSPDPVPPFIVAESLDEPPSVLRTMVRLARDRPCLKVAKLAPAVRSPTLFIHGSKDALVEMSYANNLAALVPGARFIALDGGHMLHLTQPQLVNPLLREWAA